MCGGADRRRCGLSLGYPKEMPARVTVVMRDGRELMAEKTDFLGFAHTRPLDWSGVLEKFERLDGPELDRGLLRDILAAVAARHRQGL
jgi:2-methylcitrate dehydratase PrpD